jgi:hypothetical protein
MKKIKEYILLLIILGGILFFPLASFAGYYTVEYNNAPYSVEYNGIVPCGICSRVNPALPATIKDECGQIGVAPKDLVPIKYMPCQICHLFVMMNDILQFVLIIIIPPIATLVFIITGIMFFLAGASPEKSSKGKAILTSAIIGLVLIYGSWLIINTVLTQMGVTQWTGLTNWFQVTCLLKIPM